MFSKSVQLSGLSYATHYISSINCKHPAIHRMGSVPSTLLPRTSKSLTGCVNVDVDHQGQSVCPVSCFVVCYLNYRPICSVTYQSVSFSVQEPN